MRAKCSSGRRETCFQEKEGFIILVSSSERFAFERRAFEEEQEDRVVLEKQFVLFWGSPKSAPSNIFEEEKEGLLKLGEGCKSVSSGFATYYLFLLFVGRRPKTRRIDFADVGAFIAPLTTAFLLLIDDPGGSCGVAFCVDVDVSYKTHHLQRI
ncbi:hypothetical protein G7Y89_g7944 [Cudoniella acicularis]|uniref:Uncharacterized protein n=1 Tax=Cudoniella acicularis TaxID=354080 RepID=A0A8H4RJ33_9HELO|nr:hypothetical protein G7Y89_g7944 [Cudoniella acicularis]